MELASELRLDVMLMKYTLPDLQASEATRAVLHRSPATRVLVFAAPSNWEDLETTIQAGASGFLARDTPGDGVVACVRAAAAAASPRPPRAAEQELAALRRIDALRRPDSRLFDRLTRSRR